MNLDELRAVQSRERATDSLQDLRESFYEDAAAYVEALREERERAADEADDPFSAPEVARLTDEIEMAEQVVEAIYERRVGKIVKQASLAAAGMAGDAVDLTPEERALYEDLVDRIGENKETVLAALAGETDGGPDDDSGLDDRGRSVAAGGGDNGPETESRAEPSEDSSPGTESGADDGALPPGETVQVAGRDEDMVRGGGDGTTHTPGDRDPEPTSDDPATGPGGRGGSDAGAAGGDGGGGAGDEDGDAPAEDSRPDVERTTVRITSDVGEILGVDEQVYRLESEDVVRLPEANARPLLDREAAERLG